MGHAKAVGRNSRRRIFLVQSWICIRIAWSHGVADKETNYLYGMAAIGFLAMDTNMINLSCLQAHAESSTVKPKNAIFIVWRMHYI